MDQKPLNIAIVGCGNIAGAYGKTLQPYSQLKLLGATSRTLKRAEDFVATFGGKVYPSLEAILADNGCLFEHKGPLALLKGESVSFASCKSHHRYDRIVKGEMLKSALPFGA